jgi:type IV pilus assembly protein PilA
MLARMQKSMKEKDQGFTLIELLVVMIIIGILAAIAIPVFLNQRKKAVDASTKSDIRTIAAEMETFFTDSQAYAGISQTGDAVTITGGPVVTVSTGNTFTATALATATTRMAAFTSATSGYCLNGRNTKGSVPGTGFYYNSLAGGFTTTPCPTTP